jgi:hypothetical protein
MRDFAYQSSFGFWHKTGRRFERGLRAAARRIASMVAIPDSSTAKTATPAVIIAAAPDRSTTTA